MLTTLDTLVILTSVGLCWIGAAAVMNAILARIFGWKDDE